MAIEHVAQELARQIHIGDEDHLAAALAGCLDHRYRGRKWHEVVEFDLLLHLHERINCVRREVERIAKLLMDRAKRYVGVKTPSVSKCLTFRGAPRIGESMR